MTDDWAVVLPQKFSRRVDDGDLVIWRPGFTMRIAVWNNDRKETAEQRLSWIMETMSPDAYDVEEDLEGHVLRLNYRLVEETDDDRVSAFYCYAVAEHSHVQIAFYFDDEEDLTLAREIWRSLDSRRTAGKTKSTENQND
jgi:hypothetical protein